MLVIQARNVHQALPQALALLEASGVKRNSRNGEVIMIPVPVTTFYTAPMERVLFWRERDANPFFHFFEALWMLAGRNDVAYLTQFNKRMAEFSDNGKVFHGAYGHRWRVHFERDQLRTIAARLRQDPTDRRCVLQIWDEVIDLDQDSKDIPCNTQVYFWIGVQGQLNMTVTCRSNDIVWGAYGANAVHFSILQEFMAAYIDVPVGGYWHVSNNLHAYPKTLEPVRKLAGYAQEWSFRPHLPRCPYSAGVVEPVSLVHGDPGAWLQELSIFLDEGPVLGIEDGFFRHVAAPLHAAHIAYREDNLDTALDHVERCRAPDWKAACAEWIQRRAERRAARRQRAEDDGVNYEE